MLNANMEDKNQFFEYIACLKAKAWSYDKIVINQSSGSHQWSSGGHQVDIRGSSGGHQAVIRQSSGGHQAVIRQSSDKK